MQIQYRDLPVDAVRNVLILGERLKGGWNNNPVITHASERRERGGQMQPLKEKATVKDRLRGKEGWKFGNF